MNIVKILAIAILGVSCLMVVRSIVPSLASLIAAALGIIIIGISVSQMRGFIGYYYELCRKNGYDEYFGVMLKGLGAALTAQIGSDLCKDAGECQLATRVEFAGKVEILIIALPLVRNLIELSESILLK